MVELVLAVALLVVAVNPWRHAGTVQLGSVRRQLAVTVATGVLIAVALLAEPLLDLFDISAPTWRMTAGIVVALGGARDLVTKRPAPVEGGGAWVPLVFPILLRPEVVFASARLGVDEGILTAAVASALGVAAGAVLAAGGRGGAVTTGLARLAGAGALALGIDLIVDGVLSI